MTLYRLLICSSLALVASGADVARWSAESSASTAGIELLPNQKFPWSIQRTEAGPAAVLEPNRDYYNRAAFTARLAAPAPDGAWVRVSYLDKGVGMIALGGGAVRRGGGGRRRPTPPEQWGTLRLNTSKLRNAVIALPAGATEISIIGIPSIHAITVTDTKPPYEPTPDVPSTLKLSNPLNLVTSAGTDSERPEQLPQALARMRQNLPLLRALGFNGIESYVKWDFIESKKGVFDWTYYDAIVAECAKYNLKWFPLLIVGSSYSMPEWFHDSPENVSYECLEHGMKVDIPTIFHEGQVQYVRRFLSEFGKHYANNPNLLGIRLGPSANYGEAQYPATGDWGYKGQKMHTHLGYWVGDPYAQIAFRRSLEKRYATIADLNKAWGGTTYASFDAVKTFLPVSARNNRMRQDFSTWYMDAMTEWCEKWATWAREALPTATIYQSSGGWGAVEIGTDYFAHTKSMAKLKGGIRLTNENDSYVNNFCVTRPAASAARFYGARFGTEPAGFSSVRGVMNRLYNIITNNGQHLFYYDGNLWSNDQSPDMWMKYAPLLDQRAQPQQDVAVFYPDTANKLSDGVMRWLGGASFFNAAYAFRSVMDYDFANEQMILDGALDKFKVLVFLVGRDAEQPAIEKIDAWIRKGGVVIFPSREGSNQRPLASVEGDATIFEKWRKGDTGKGRVIFYDWHPITKDYCDFLRKQLSTIPEVRKELRDAVAMTKPETTYWALLTTGKLVFLNYGDDPAEIKLVDGRTLTVEPYGIGMK